MAFRLNILEQIRVEILVKGFAMVATETPPLPGRSEARCRVLAASILLSGAQLVLSRSEVEAIVKDTLDDQQCLFDALKEDDLSKMSPEEMTEKLLSLLDLHHGADKNNPH